MRTWERDDPDLGRPIAAPLDRCAELLGVELATVCKVAVNVEPYVRADGTKIWSLMQLERQLRPEAFGPRRAGGYIPRRRVAATPECQRGDGDVAIAAGLEPDRAGVARQGALAHLRIESEEARRLAEAWERGMVCGP
jgi:hypothetical protein